MMNMGINMSIMKHHFSSNANENEIYTYTVIPKDISVDNDMKMISLSFETLLKWSFGNKRSLIFKENWFTVQNKKEL